MKFGVGVYVKEGKFAWDVNLRLVRVFLSLSGCSNLPKRVADLRFSFTVINVRGFLVLIFVPVQPDPL